MKSFILSAIIFAILIILVISNSIYIHHSCDEMLSLSANLTISDINGVKALCDAWQKHKAIFSISIHDSHIDKITELTEDIKSAATQSNGAEFEKNIILLNELLDEVKKIEEISFQGIL